MRHPGIACAAVLLLSTPAFGQTRAWILDDNPEAPALVYGVPDSDDVLLSFSCEPSDKRMTITESIPSKTLIPGGSATFRLTAGSTSLDLNGDAIANESDGTVSIETSGPPNPRVFALLKAGPSLTIEVAGSKETIPLADAAPHVPVLERLCLGRK